MKVWSVSVKPAGGTTGSVNVRMLDWLAPPASAPTLQDRSNRGRLVGERVDRLTWVVEQPGDFALPAIRFQWWNPVAEQLQDLTIPGITFTAEAGPGYLPSTTSAVEPATSDGPWRPAGFIALLLALAAWVSSRHPKVRYGLGALRHRILPPPRALLRSLNPGPRNE